MANKQPGGEERGLGADGCETSEGVKGSCGPAYIRYYKQPRTSGVSAYVRTKDRGVCLPNLAYVRSKSSILQNTLMADPNDQKSKLIL